MADTRIRLSSRALRALAKPVVGRGGHQTLLRKLQRQIAGETLEVSAADMEKMLRYMLSYGRGGFQGRLAAATGARGRRKR